MREEKILKMLETFEGKRLTDNNDYVSFKVNDWFAFKKQITLKSDKENK